MQKDIQDVIMHHYRVRPSRPSARAVTKYQTRLGRYSQSGRSLMHALQLGGCNVGEYHMNE
jgi:hypothetical protein